MRSAQKRGSSHGKEDAYTSDFDDESLHGQKLSSSNHPLDISSSQGGSKHGNSSSLGTPRKVPGETKNGVIRAILVFLCYSPDKQTT